MNWTAMTASSSPISRVITRIPPKPRTRRMKAAN
jgi:hypothetical protein